MYIGKMLYGNCNGYFDSGYGSNRRVVVMQGSTPCNGQYLGWYVQESRQCLTKTADIYAD